MGTGLTPRTILITGAGGLLGGCVDAAFADAGFRTAAATHAELDVTDPAAVSAAMDRLRPELVVHCAAMTNVDACESEPDAARAINEAGSANVAEAADAAGAAVVAVSTDYVFDGTKGTPYLENDDTNPLQAYGLTKLEGEVAVRAAADRHFVVRSAWIYGRGGKNFISRLPDLAAAGAPITAVMDQTGSPTYAPDLARAIVALSRTQAYGTYHVTNSGSCTFSELCRLALQLSSIDAEVQDVLRRDLGRPAPRPENTTLANEAWRALGLAPLRDWRQALAEFVGGGPS
ncbi:MAG TPA: dTDP-4-dehydrorhamnose reductase [Actinomycetota bacterium]|nr:dTDP-4-dehydrorhamnose reductase [Actinomycetota bacterium]